LRNDNDRQALPVLRDQFASQLAGDKELENVTKSLGWDEARKLPVTTYTDLVTKLQNEANNLAMKLDKAESELKKARADYKGLLDTEIASRTAAEEGLKLAQKQNLELQSKMAKELEDRLAEFGDLAKIVGELKKKNESDVGDREKKITALERKIKEVNEHNEKLRTQLTPPDLLKFSPPKGKIIRIDPKGEVAWINLGSDENIKPSQGVTFSIFGSGGLKANNERKGALEVVNVQGPHLSMARITEVVDPNSNPIVTGDLLINPGWDPNSREHVAIAGLIDLTGDGRDNVEEFKRNLQKQGIVIDAYFNWKDQTIEGEGMNLKTDYLIVGDSPKFSFDRLTKDENPKITRQKDIVDKITAMRNEAQRLGVTVVPFRRYVSLTGYKLPQGAHVQEGAGYDTPIRSTPTAGDKKGEKPPAKGEKKEDKKDDEDK
jgi:hypothetical protein